MQQKPTIRDWAIGTGKQPARISWAQSCLNWLKDLGGSGGGGGGGGLR